MVLLFIPIAWILTAAGRNVAGWLHLPVTASRLERSLIGFAIGLGLLAYGMLLIGVLKILYPAVGFAWLGVLAILGGKEHGALTREIKQVTAVAARSKNISPWWILYAAFALISFVGVLTPPVLGLAGSDFTEWDSIAYHLADPKLYLKAHAITYLPWESHSNFGFTTEMWYTLGLMANSVPLAKMFHFACGIGAALAVYAFGRRFLNPKIGALAAGLLVSTPLFFWEAGTAYADLAPAFFCILALLCLGNGYRFRDNHWLMIGAVIMGLMLSTKATAVVTLILGAVAVLIGHLRHETGWGKSIRLAVLWGVLAFAVGSPWMIKSAVYTGNPVYPFYYNLFGGRYWSAENATAYHESDMSFGMGHSVREAYLMPWNLTMYLQPGHPTTFPHPFNNFPSSLAALGPMFLGCLFVFPFFAGRAPLVVKALAGYAALTLVFWFATMQYVRYLTPALPAFCLLAAWVAHRALATRSLSGYALAGLMACSFAFSSYVGADLAARQTPAAFGQMAKDEFIQKGFPAYAAMQFINTQLPADAKVVTYGLPLGFYCDKDYLWGDAGHSTYIPYGEFKSAQDLRDYLYKIGVTHIIINLNKGYGFSFGDHTGYPGWVYALTFGSGTPPIYAGHNTAVFTLPK